MGPRPPESSTGGTPQQLTVTPAELHSAGRSVANESSQVTGLQDPTCTTPAMPGSQSDAAIEALTSAASSSKNVVAGRLMAISETLTETSIVVIRSDELSASGLAGLGDLNSDLPVQQFYPS